MAERTLLLIKPDAVKNRRIGEIISRVEQAGFEITGIVMRRLTPDEAQKFYAVHRGKGFFQGLVEFISSGPVVALRLEGAECQRRLRALVGATDPACAAPGSLRREFGTSVRANAVHASNPDEDVDHEINFFFPEETKQKER